MNRPSLHTFLPFLLGIVASTLIIGSAVAGFAQGLLPTLPDRPDRIAPQPSQGQISSSQAGDAPHIDRVFPQSGPPQQYISIEGMGFGDSAGTAAFGVRGVATAADTTSFPKECTGLWWKQKTIIVKVPNIQSGTTMLKIKRPDGSVSNEVRFVVNQGAPTPGICGLCRITGLPEHR